MKLIKQTQQKQRRTDEGELKAPQSGCSVTYPGCIHSLYTLTRVYVLLLVCDMFPGRLAHPSDLSVPTEGGCYWGEPDSRG